MRVVLDDNLIRDHLTGRQTERLVALLAEHTPATTNLYLYRLVRSAMAARGGQLTRDWPAGERRALAGRLASSAATIEIVPMQGLIARMAELSTAHRLSTLGAEAVAAAERLDAALCVTERDDGGGIRAACAAVGVEYVVVAD